MKRINNLETILGTLISRSQPDSQFNEAILKLLDNGEANFLAQCIELEIEGIVYFEHKRRNFSYLKLPEWRSAFDAVDNKVGNLFEVLDEISTLLEAQGIDLLLLKNTGIAKAGSLPYGANPMGDIDLLVRSDCLMQVDTIMLSNGFVRKTQKENIEPHEFEYLASRGGEELRIEIQTRPVSGRWISKDQEPSGEFLWNNSKKIDGSNYFTFKPELALLLVALHTAKHSFVRAPGFRLHTDVDRIVFESNINWTEFVLLAQKFKVIVPVYFSLLLAHRFLGTKIPLEVLKELKPGFLKVYFIEKSLKKVGYLEPLGKKWGRVSYILFVMALFDDTKQLLRSIFPDLQHPSYGYQALYKKYGFFTHALRISDLIFNRKNY